MGRAAERRALAAALSEHRLVTAVGPGGTGKTRLALVVAEDVSSGRSEGACYVDLVPVTDPTMVGAAIAGAFGFGEQPGRSPAETVVAKLAASDVLVVLDNCEHVLEGVGGLVERLLAGCPRVAVLATSRSRLRVPFEYVFPVPGLSLDAGVGGHADGGDAATLFRERASMTGWTSAYAADDHRIADICRRLDGMALAIELAAARVSTIGLDGLGRGLADPLGLLTGGSRLDQRHESLRTALGWSFGLLAPEEHAAIRRASVFAGAFTAATAAVVTAGGPLPPDRVAGALAGLADHHLVVVVDGPAETRYRMLETIRQYGAELMEPDERDDVALRHLRWSLDSATRLRAAGAAAGGFDDVADDLRAALRWAADRPARRAEAHRLALLLAELTFARGRPSETQERYEDAAALAADDADAADAAAALHLGAVVAWGRHVGNDAIRLFRAAAAAARRAGDPQRAALELLSAAELVTNAPGIMSERVPPGEERELLAQARVLAAGDVHVEAAILTVTTAADELDPAYAELAERAVELARRVGDARLESHSLDQLTAARLVWGDLAGAVATVRRRLELLADRAHDVEMAWEYPDVLHMAPLVYVAAGDLPTARRARPAAQRGAVPARGRPPCGRVAAHHGCPRRPPRRGGRARGAVPSRLDRGRPPAARRDRLRTGRRRHGARPAGRRGGAHRLVAHPRRDAPCGRPPPRAADHLQPRLRGCRGAPPRRARDRARPAGRQPRVVQALARRGVASVVHRGVGRGGVLAGLADRRHRLDRARFLARGNPVAGALVERAAALDAGDHDTLRSLADVLDDAGCPYQRARTLVLAGGEARVEGREAMAALGADPMAEIT